MKVYKTTKTALRLHPKAAAFLQGISANTPEAVENAFLNRHGRIVAVFVQRYFPEADACLLLVETAFVPMLRDHLQRFLMVSGVRLDVLADDVWHVFEPEGRTVSSITQDSLIIPYQKGWFQLGAPDNKADSVDEHEYRLWRVRHNVPLQGVDFSNEFVLNVGERYVSFDKGCFLGQEPVAKVHHRSSPSRRLCVVCENEVPDDKRKEITSRIFDPQENCVKGFWFVPQR